MNAAKTSTPNPMPGWTACVRIMKYDHYIVKLTNSGRSLSRYNSGHSATNDSNRHSLSNVVQASTDNGFE